jgi:ElaB/YqjD/DUF883 family membrane-anchored ribosome-binding protein
MTNLTDTQRVIGELQDVIANAQHLLHRTTDTIEGGAAATRVGVQRSVRAANQLLRRSQRAITYRGRIAALATDRYVHKNPWKAMGLAAGIAFAIGCLIVRRSRD